MYYGDCLLPIIANSVEWTSELGSVSATQQSAFLVKHVVVHRSIPEHWVGDVLPRSPSVCACV